MEVFPRAIWHECSPAIKMTEQLFRRLEISAARIRIEGVERTLPPSSRDASDGRAFSILLATGLSVEKISELAGIPEAEIRRFIELGKDSKRRDKSSD